MLKKTTWLFLGQVTSRGLAFLFYICVARTFGKSGIGDYAFAFALAALFGIGVELGFRHLITRDIAKDHSLAIDYFGNIMVLQISLALIIGLLLYLSSMKLGYSSQVKFLLTFAFIGITLKALGLSFVASLEAVEAMDKSAILEVLARIVIVAVGFALLLIGAQLKIIMIAHAAGGAAYLAMAIYWARRYFGPLTLNVDPQLIKTTFYAVLPFAGASALYVLYARMDMIMIHHFIGETETGIYAVAVRLVTTPLFVASLVGLAMYPTLSRTSEQDTAKHNALFLSTLKWLGILGTTGAVIATVLGDRLVVIFFGNGFVASGMLVRWMGILFFLGCVTVPYWRLLFATNREITQLRIQGISVGLNLILNILLIPAWGAFGAVWASIISEVFLAVMLHLSCAKLVPAPYVAMAGRLFLAGGFSIATGMLLRDFLPWPILLMVTIASLVGASLAFRLITPEDQRRVRAGLQAWYLKTVGS
jgi:O-antigen/teichoic acid export membrane protein